MSDAVSENCFDPTIHPLGDKGAVNIRITNINLETTDSAIHSMCTSYGSLEGLVRTKEDAVDAFFRIKDNADIDSILAKYEATYILFIPRGFFASLLSSCYSLNYTICSFTLRVVTMG